jgi:hypothetical protein
MNQKKYRHRIQEKGGILIIQKASRKMLNLASDQEIAI